MLRNVFVCIFAASLTIMLSSSYILVNHLQASMTNEVNQSYTRINRLKQTVRVHDYLLKINHPENGLDNNQNQLDELNELLMGENHVLNRNDHRKYRHEIAILLNLKQIPETTLVNSWLTSSMLNDMIELEKNYQPTQLNVAPIVMLSDSRWSVIFGFLWLSTIIAAFSGGAIVGGLFTKSRLS